MTSSGTVFDLVDESKKEERLLAEKEKKAGFAKQIKLGVAQGAQDLVGMGKFAMNAAMFPFERIGGLTEKGREQQRQIKEYEEANPPTEYPETGLLQEVVRRGTRTIPNLLGGPTATGFALAREGLGLGAKEAVKKAGGGEFAQTAADLGASLTPIPSKIAGSSSRTINAAATGKTATQKEMIDAARKLGMSEAEIAPLVREGRLADFLRNVSSKSGKTTRALDQTNAAVQRNFQTLATRESAQIPIAKAGRSNLVKSLENSMEGLSRSERAAIKGDMADLLKSEVSGKDLINFWGDINSKYKEFPRLQGLKNSISSAIKSISPELMQEFEMANTLSQRYRTISSRLKPSTTSALFSAGEAFALLGSIPSGNLPLIGTIAGTAASRKLAELMTTSPKFQNLTKNLVTSLNAGQFKATMKIIDDLSGLISKADPETAARLRTISEDELKEILSQES